MSLCPPGPSLTCRGPVERGLGVALASEAQEAHQIPFRRVSVATQQPLPARPCTSAVPPHPAWARSWPLVRTCVPQCLDVPTLCPALQPCVPSSLTWHSCWRPCLHHPPPPAQSHHTEGVRGACSCQGPRTLALERGFAAQKWRCQAESQGLLLRYLAPQQLAGEALCQKVINHGD